jgi:hypothetical protein
MQIHTKENDMMTIESALGNNIGEGRQVLIKRGILESWELRTDPNYFVTR